MTVNTQKLIYRPRILLLDDDNIILKATEKTLKGLNADNCIHAQCQLS